MSRQPTNSGTIRHTNSQGATNVDDVVETRVSGGATQTADGFKPSQYDADLTMSATGTAVALASGVSLGDGRIHIVNQGVTTEAIRVAFGTSSANALDNLTIVAGAATTGYYMPSNVDVPAGGIATLGVPALATHYAVAPAVAGDVQVVSVTQGV
jgi:hypothetical protein